ncbi:MAG: ATP-binding cassette, subfamily bacterial [Actinomycetota bacterium]|nr:ATP-binding cassette, subfamily bacterial [Actinomycetota bacterium]
MRERALWRVGPYLRPHKKRMGFIAGSAMLSIGAQLAIPLIAKAAIDGPIHDGNKRALVPLLVLAVVLGLFELSLTYRRRLTLARVATSVETELRDDFYEHLQRLEVGFHDRWQSGQLLSRANSDISLIRRFAAFGAVFLLIIVMEVIAIFALLLSLDVPLGLLTIATAIPVLVLCRRFERTYHVVVRDIQDQTGDLTTMLEEAARGIRVLKSFGRGDEMFRRYDARCRQLRETELERVKIHTQFIWVLGLIPNLTLAAVLLAGAFAVSSGALTVGGLVAFVSYLLILVFPIEELAWILAMAEEAETAAGRVWEVFDTEPFIADRPNAATLVRADGEVRFDGVDFSYPGSEKAVLCGFDLAIHPGETLALVGATGAGKTTVATLLVRLHDATGGKVTLDGHDVRDLTLRSLRAQVGFAFEEPTLFSASVRENLLIGHPDASEAEIEAALAVAQASFAFDLPWGLDTRIGEQGLSLSGGQRQRLALARAIVGRPRVLVLDDPLSALDVHTEARVEDALRPILADRTALVVVHRPSTIALADRAALIDGGRIVATGSHHDLLGSEPRYAAILSQAAENIGESGDRSDDQPDDRVA